MQSNVAREAAAVRLTIRPCMHFLVDGVCAAARKSPADAHRLKRLKPAPRPPAARSAAARVLGTYAGGESGDADGIFFLAAHFELKRGSFCVTSGTLAVSSPSPTDSVNDISPSLAEE